jgi:hypothetical protein
MNGTMTAMANVPARDEDLLLMTTVSSATPSQTEKNNDIVTTSNENKISYGLLRG